MRDRINSIASSTAKSLRSIISEAVVLQQEPPSKSELTWGIFVRGAGIPIALAAFFCLIIDWDYAVDIGKDWVNTFSMIAFLASTLLNGFLFVNMLLRLRNSPQATIFRRCLAYVDLVVIALLIVGFVERSSDHNTSVLMSDEPQPSNAHALIFTFSLLLAFVHFIAGAMMTIAATKNWIRIQRLSPEEYRDYREGVRPLDPPPAYGG